MTKNKVKSKDIVFSSLSIVPISLQKNISFIKGVSISIILIKIVFYLHQCVNLRG